MPCETDEQCGSGLCDLDTGRCVAPARRLVGLELVPPSGNKQGWVLQEFPDARPDPDARLELTLKDAKSVQGQVFASHALETPVPARITATRESQLPGRPPIQVTVSTDESDDHRFVLWLEGGHQYTFQVKALTPNEQRFPPRVVSLDVAEHVKRDFVLDGDDRAVEVQGRVVQGNGKPLLFSVEVEAFRPGTSVRSTVAVTCSKAHLEAQPDRCREPDAEEGSFVLRVPPGVEAYTIRVKPLGLPTKELTSYNPIPIVPTTECTGKVLGLVETNKNRLQQRIAKPFRLPTFLEAKMFSIGVVGGSEEGEPVTGVRLKFTTELPVKAAEGFESCSASYSHTGVTDAEGKLQLPLLPGASDENRTYRMTALSPAGSAFASQLLTTEIGAAAGVLQTVVLEDRYALSGVVVDPDDQGVGGALIEARGIETTKPDRNALPPGTASTTADDKGNFVLHVDPGVYNLHIRPPQDAGLPQFGIDKRVIDGPLEGLVLRSPVPQVLTGQVSDAGGSPVAGFTINSYEAVSDSLSSEQAVLRAHAQTDGEGQFRLLLPPSP